jgi:hypothetical protein
MAGVWNEDNALAASKILSHQFTIHRASLIGTDSAATKQCTHDHTFPQGPCVRTSDIEVIGFAGHAEMFLDRTADLDTRQ